MNEGSAQRKGSAYRKAFRKRQQKYLADHPELQRGIEEAEQLREIEEERLSLRRLKNRGEKIGAPWNG